jgi:GT2 family glycosyltransferase
VISIVTPWLDASELCPIYEKSVRGAQAVIVDNGSGPGHAVEIQRMVKRLGGVYIRNETNCLFATANNQGLAAATGEIIVFMNNDVEARYGFLEKIERVVQPGALYGPSKLSKYGVDYLEGWCIAAHRDVWMALSGWDDEYYTGLYWEDNDLCLRALTAGYKLVQTILPVWHYNNYTSARLPDAKAHSADNERKFLERVRQWRQG